MPAHALATPVVFHSACFGPPRPKLLLALSCVCVCMCVRVRACVRGERGLVRGTNLPWIISRCCVVSYGTMTDDDATSLSSWASESSYNTTPSIHSLGGRPMPLPETAEAMARRYSTTSQHSTASLLRAGQ